MESNITLEPAEHTNRLQLLWKLYLNENANAGKILKMAFFGAVKKQQKGMQNGVVKTI